MAARSQRRKAKKQQRKRKKEQQRNRRAEKARRAGADRRKQGSGPPVASAGNARHVQRISRQRPRAWSGERPEDVAVFDDAVLDRLPGELADQVRAVRDALQLACDRRGEEALQRVADIARRSPLSQWRLFLRGLVVWLADDPEAASEAWSRLDMQRRPGRMAVAMMNSLRADLKDDSSTQGEPAFVEGAAKQWSEQLDKQLLYHAKLLRRARFDRTAIRIAQAGLQVPEESSELLLGPRKIQWIKRFVAEHRTTEPDLTTAVQQAALGRAVRQRYVDLFEDATKSLEGPPHDRRNLLLSFFYLVPCRNDARAVKKAERSLSRYLEQDLPHNEELSEPLRAAIASQIHLEQARSAIRPSVSGMLSFLQSPEDPKDIRKHLKAAIRGYPENLAAYKAYVDWLETRLENDRLTKPERAPLLKEQADVMAQWSKAAPNEVRPRLWLVDYLLENERTEEAKPHVDWLATARQDDPLVRAAPWKWQMLEAMRLCRRKAWLKDVPAHLDEAERQWPAWLSRDWLPYLRAALALRAGDTDEFEAHRQRLCQSSGLPRDGLADACMMLGAAQRMRVPAPQLKPLRTPVDQAVKRLGELSDEELLSVTGFFWDLRRAGLLYPAYRMHGGKIVAELFACLRENPRWVHEHRDDARVQAAILLCSEHRCLGDGYELTLPDWYREPAIEQHPMFAAAKLNAVVKLRFGWRAAEYQELGTQVREMAPSQRDPYYRYWFVSLADELDDVITAASTRGFGFPFPFNFDPSDIIFGGDDDDDDFDDDDDDFDDDDFDDALGFDPHCGCPNCRAARAAHEAARQF